MAIVEDKKTENTDYYVVSAEKALDVASTCDKLLVVFSHDADFSKLWKSIKRICEIQRVTVFCVEPVEEAAYELQVNKFPSYLYFRNGNEEFNIVGNKKFLERLGNLKL